VREQFTHACYSHDVINLQVHSVCALSAKFEKFTWKQDEGNNNFRLFLLVNLQVPLFFVFFLFPSLFLFLSSLSSASLSSPPVYLSFRSFQTISHPLFLSPYAAQFSFMSPSVSFYSPCSPPFSFFFLCLFAPLVFHHLSLVFISQRMPSGATFGLVTTCRGIVAVKHSL